MKRFHRNLRFRVGMILVIIVVGMHHYAHSCISLGIDKVLNTKTDTVKPILAYQNLGSQISKTSYSGQEVLPSASSSSNFVRKKRSEKNLASFFDLNDPLLNKVMKKLDDTQPPVSIIHHVHSQNVQISNARDGWLYILNNENLLIRKIEMSGEDQKIKMYDLPAGQYTISYISDGKYIKKNINHLGSVAMSR